MSSGLPLYMLIILAFRILQSASEWHLVDVSGDHIFGNAIFKQVDTKVAMVAANIGNPVAGRNKIAAGKQPFGKGYFHKISP